MYCNSILFVEYYTCQRFLSRMRVIFVSYYPNFRKNSWRLPNIAEDVPMISEGAECRGAKLKISAPSCQDHAYLKRDI